jgi:voltage-gated potassium channel
MDQIEQETKLATYQRVSTIPLLIVGILFIASFIALNVDDDQISISIFYATWAIFILDYLLQFYFAKKKWRFVTTHIFYLIALIIPVLRVYALFGVFRRLFWNKNSTVRDLLGLGAIFATILIVVFGGLLTLIFEESAPNANITTYGHALWWASTTVTTVGYGDYVPVTVGGRLVGVGVISTGVVVLAVLTAAVVQWFTSDRIGNRSILPANDAVVAGAHTGKSTVTPPTSQVGHRDTQEAHNPTPAPGDYKPTSAEANSDQISEAAANTPASRSPSLESQASHDDLRTVSQQVGAAEQLSPDPTQLKILTELQALNSRLAALEKHQLAATPVGSAGSSDLDPTMESDGTT